MLNQRRIVQKSLRGQHKDYCGSVHEMLRLLPVRDGLLVEKLPLRKDSRELPGFFLDIKLAAQMYFRVEEAVGNGCCQPRRRDPGDEYK